MARDLAEGFERKGYKLAYPREGNEVFVMLPEASVQKLQAAGAAFYPWPGGASHFVCSWSTEAADIHALLGAL